MIHFLLYYGDAARGTRSSIAGWAQGCRKTIQQFVDDVRAKGAGVRNLETSFPGTPGIDPRSEDSKTHHCAGRGLEPASI